MIRPTRKPRRRDFPSDNPAARRARQQTLRRARIDAGKCERCDVLRGEDGTSTHCRGCADDVNSRNVRSKRRARVTP